NSELPISTANSRFGARPGSDTSPSSSTFSTETATTTVSSAHRKPCTTLLCRSCTQRSTSGVTLAGTCRRRRAGLPLLRRDRGLPGGVVGARAASDRGDGGARAVAGRPALGARLTGDGAGRCPAKACRFASVNRDPCRRSLLRRASPLGAHPALTLAEQVHRRLVARLGPLEQVVSVAHGG